MPCPLHARASPAATARPRPWLAPVTTPILASLTTSHHHPRSWHPASRSSRRHRTDARNATSTQGTSRCPAVTRPQPPVSLQLAQCRGQHLLADPLDSLLELAIPGRSPIQRRGNHRPGVSNQIQRRPRRAVSDEHVIGDHAPMSRPPPATAAAQSRMFCASPAKRIRNHASRRFGDLSPGHLRRWFSSGWRARPWVGACLRRRGPRLRLAPGVLDSGRVPHSRGQVLAGQAVRVWAAGYRCGMNDVEQVPRLRPEVTVTLTRTR